MVTTVRVDTPNKSKGPLMLHETALFVHHYEIMGAPHPRKAFLLVVETGLTLHDPRRTLPMPDKFQASNDGTPNFAATSLSSSILASTAYSAPGSYQPLLCRETFRKSVSAGYLRAAKNECQ